MFSEALIPITLALAAISGVLAVPGPEAVIQAVVSLPYLILSIPFSCHPKRDNTHKRETEKSSTT